MSFRSPYPTLITPRHWVRSAQVAKKIFQSDRLRGKLSESLFFDVDAHLEVSLFSSLPVPSFLCVVVFFVRCRLPPLWLLFFVFPRVCVSPPNRVP